MFFNDVGCYPISKKITLLVGSILLLKIVSAHRCFVCGPHDQDVNINKGNLTRTCDQFNLNNPIFIRECPLNYKGCSIQTNGTIITRTCERYPIVDCKTANNVEYCYCILELCNDFHPTLGDEEDAEAETEGSGNNIIIDVTRVLQSPSSSTPQTIVPSQPSHNSQLKTYRTNTLLMTFILIFVHSIQL